MCFTNIVSAVMTRRPAVVARLGRVRPSQLGVPQPVFAEDRLRRRTPSELATQAGADQSLRRDPGGALRDHLVRGGLLRVCAHQDDRRANRWEAPCSRPVVARLANYCDDTTDDASSRQAVQMNVVSTALGQRSNGRLARLSQNEQTHSLIMVCRLCLSRVPRCASTKRGSMFTLSSLARKDSRSASVLCVD